PELNIINTPLGGLDSKQVIYATWAVEGLSVLAWALGCLGLPRHDEKVDPYAVPESVGFLNQDAAEFIETAKLRSVAELEAYRELLYAIHSRLRDFIRHKQPNEFETWIDERWLDLLKIDRASLIVDGDLSIDEKAIFNVEQERVRSCEWLIGE